MWNITRIPSSHKVCFLTYGFIWLNVVNPRFVGVTLLCKILTRTRFSFRLSSAVQIISRILGFDVSICQVCGFLKHPLASP